MVDLEPEMTQGIKTTKKTFPPEKKLSYSLPSSR